MCGKNVGYEEIYTEGITKISSRDFLYAKQMDKSIAAYACFKQIVAVILSGNSDQLRAMAGDQLLIGSTHAFTGTGKMDFLQWWLPF